MRTWTVAKRLIKQISADKRTVGLLFVAPVFVLYLLNIILTSSATKPNIDVINIPDTFLSSLKEEANVIKVDSEAIALQDLKDKSSDAYITFNQNAPKVKLEGADPTITSLVLSIINKTLSKKLAVPAKGIPQGSIVPKPEISFLYGSKDMTTFDYLAPLLMGFFIFFFVFLIAGVSFLRERISGTLERILATPLWRGEIVWGYFFGFGAFAAIQTVVIQLFIVYGLKVTMAGSFWAVLLINLLLAAGSLSLGTLLSAFARNEFQLFQFIPVVIIPQILFSGIFALREAPQWVIYLSKVFPMTYGAEALRDIMIRGLGIEDVLKDVCILLSYAVLFVILNIFALKKYRKV